jgi:3-methyladenine DNA glycosylase/8-oxoguanine DNA glycosylase
MAASGSPPTPDARAQWPAPYLVDLSAVLGPFLRGSGDPAWRRGADGRWWWATRTPDGLGTLCLTADRDGLVSADAWGPGSAWLVADVPALLGFRDDPAGFPAEALPERLQPVWSDLVMRWRVPGSHRVLEALVAAILEQKVTGVESRRGWRHLLTEVGEPAPGPAPEGMFVMPDPAGIRLVPSWQWHRWGIQPQQSATIVRAAQVAGRLEQCVDLSLDDARRRLAAVNGIGPWTVAEVAGRALGDPDAVSFGDFHLAGSVVFAFTGRSDGTDAEMAELLEPFAGHRHRVQRIVESSPFTRPRRGPRATITDHRRR